MKSFKLAALLTVLMIMATGVAQARTDQAYRQESDLSQMTHKLGRGVTNILTCWVEVPRHIALEWERTDPVSGSIVGVVSGSLWGVARLVTGVYETVTFPVPVPEDYTVMMEPEFVVEDIWGDSIPGIDEYSAIDPYNPEGTPAYPQQFNF
jgi:putative exosortase-associated protein (TIGR04073 family)